MSRLGKSLLKVLNLFQKKGSLFAAKAPVCADKGREKSNSIMTEDLNVFLISHRKDIFLSVRPGISLRYDFPFFEKNIIA